MTEDGTSTGSIQVVSSHEAEVGEAEPLSDVTLPAYFHSITITRVIPTTYGDWDRTSTDPVNRPVKLKPGQLPAYGHVIRTSVEVIVVGGWAINPLIPYEEG